MALFHFSGKSLIGKERAIQTAEIQDNNPKPEPVFFISLVGVDREGFVKKHEHIFDIYTKEYDFFGSNVKVISAQDLRDFYKKHHKMKIIRNALLSNKVDVYNMAKFFVGQHPNGHFVVDECPFRTKAGSGK